MEMTCTIGTPAPDRVDCSGASETRRRPASRALRTTCLGVVLCFATACQDSVAPAATVPQLELTYAQRDALEDAIRTYAYECGEAAEFMMEILYRGDMSVGDLGYDAATGYKVMAETSTGTGYPDYPFASITFDSINFSDPDQLLASVRHEYGHIHEGTQSEEVAERYEGGTYCGPT